MAWYNDVAEFVANPGGDLFFDTHGGERAAAEIKSGQDFANTQLTNDVNAAINPYSDAAAKYNPMANTNAYTQTANQSIDTLQNAGNDIAGKAQSFYNPMANQMMKAATDAIQGSAGGRLQSSGTMNNIANKVSTMAGEFYNDSVNHALGQANTQISGATNAAGVADTRFANQSNAQNIITQGQLDAAKARMEGNTAMTQASAEAAGQDQGLISGIFQ